MAGSKSWGLGFRVWGLWFAADIECLQLTSAVLQLSGGPSWVLPATAAAAAEAAEAATENVAAAATRAAAATAEEPLQLFMRGLENKHQQQAAATATAASLAQQQQQAQHLDAIVRQTLYPKTLKPKPCILKAQTLDPTP